MAYIATINEKHLISVAFIAYRSVIYIARKFLVFDKIQMGEGINKNVNFMV